MWADWIMNAVAWATGRREGPWHAFPMQENHVRHIRLSEPVGDPMDPEDTTGTPIVQGES